MKTDLTVAEHLSLSRDKGPRDKTADDDVTLSAPVKMYRRLGDMPTELLKQVRHLHGDGVVRVAAGDIIARRFKETK